jgi:hypothetical protein
MYTFLPSEWPDWLKPARNDFNTSVFYFILFCTVGFNVKDISEDTEKTHTIQYQYS